MFGDCALDVAGAGFVLGAVLGGLLLSAAVRGPIFAPLGSPLGPPSAFGGRVFPSTTVPPPRREWGSRRFLGRNPSGALGRVTTFGDSRGLEVCS
jgi:hypothetical protein